MWLTAPISWVFGKMLDYYVGTPWKDNFLYSHQQLYNLIKYHDKLEKNGGEIGPEAARMMMRALDLDGRGIGRRQSGSSGMTSTTDVENGESTERVETIVTWSDVKTVDIQETVDQEFLKKVKSWSYSTFPVVGTGTGKEISGGIGQPMASITTYGFLHIRVSENSPWKP